MLVCNVSMWAPRRAIAAELLEIAGADDASTSGQVLETLIDDPASADDTLDVFFGEILSDAATASDSPDAGLIAGAEVVEELTAGSTQDGTVLGAADIVAILETVTSASTQDGIVTPAVIGTNWNPGDKSSSITLSNSNLTATGTAGFAGVRAVSGHSSGKYYFELTVTTWANASTAVGIALSTANLGNFPIGSVGSAIVYNSGIVWVNNVNMGNSPMGNFPNGSIIGIAADFTASLIWFRVAPAGNWNGSATANPATGTGGISIASISGTLYPLFAPNAAGDAATANFGMSAFSGAVPSGFTAGWP
jgi:hypothetical protein